MRKVKKLELVCRNRKDEDANELKDQNVHWENRTIYFSTAVALGSKEYTVIRESVKQGKVRPW